MIPRQHFTPYSDAWFTALAQINAALASEVMYRMEEHGRGCCMVCGGTEDVEDYYPKESPLTRRLCDQCAVVQEMLIQNSRQNGH